MVFLEERNVTVVMGQSRGTRPIMYLLLERWEREGKTGDGDAWTRGAIAEIAMGTAVRK